jgi:diaminohydroxyphosphoribosylaminopyrimidine deaminase/5-amino-6-(5-phosphoribosylamino)uracil reductase
VVSNTDRRWLWEAIEHSRRCLVSPTAYSVGAVVVDGNDKEVSRGYSRDAGTILHAEQSALLRLAAEGLNDLKGATMYTSMEPCTSRSSAPQTCTELIIASGIGRVVLALREPPLFVCCTGVTTLRDAGIEVVEFPEFAPAVQAINAALLNSSPIPMLAGKSAGEHGSIAPTIPSN